jgi:ubiquinone/menaquinone biosynthesis C-methylase UbiE
VSRKSGDNNIRTGDTVAIPGNYQHAAIQSGPAAQKFWHTERFTASLEALQLAPGKKLLDVGCGSGVFANMAARQGAFVVAVDANKDAVAYANNTFGSPRAEFVNSRVDQLNFPKAHFDRISLLEVIEHIYQSQAMELLALFRKLLAPGGRLVVSTPNIHSLWPLIEKGMDRLRLSPQMGGEQHVVGYTPGSLKQLCEAASFSQVECRTIFVASPFVAYLSQRAARTTYQLEQKVPFPLGCLIISTFESKK